MAHKKVFETLYEAQDFVRPWVDKASADLGCGYDWYNYTSGGYYHQNGGDWYTGVHLKYLGYHLGSIMLDYHYCYDNAAKEEWNEDPHIRLTLNTKVIFEMKSVFTKTNMRHDINIKLNVNRDMTTSDKDYKKYIDWAKLIMKQLKTAEAKKRKFQADVDFE